MALTFASVSGGRTPAARRRSVHTVASSGCCARRSSQYVTSSRSSAASLSRATGSVIGPTTGTTTNALPRRSARNGGRSVRRYFGLRGRSWGYLLEIGQEERTGLAAVLRLPAVVRSAERHEVVRLRPGLHAGCVRGANVVRLERASAVTGEAAEPYAARVPLEDVELHGGRDDRASGGLHRGVAAEGHAVCPRARRASRSAAVFWRVASSRRWWARASSSARSETLASLPLGTASKASSRPKTHWRSESLPPFDMIPAWRRTSSTPRRSMSPRSRRP